MGKSTSILIHNIGTLVSGEVENPILGEDSVLVKDGVIKRIGSYKVLKDESIDLDIDIQGMTLCPGLIDGHTHPAIGDWAPAVNMIGWMESSLHAGITTIISQGEQFPGRPLADAAGLKATAVLARKTFDKYRPGGVKVHAGALIVEDCLTEDDIKEVADAGVWRLAEIGFGVHKDFDKTLRLVKAAKKCGMKVTVHYGGPSMGTLQAYSVDEIIQLDPDVAVHFNGGPLRYSLPDMKLTVESCPCFLELVPSGNHKALIDAINLVRERGELRRIVLGTDAPTSGICNPQAMIRLIAEISSVSDIPGAVVLAMATGNTARAYGLDTGVVKPGSAADLVVIDAPAGSMAKTALEEVEMGGRLAIGMVMVDGKVITTAVRMCAQTAKKVLINGKEAEWAT